MKTHQRYTEDQYSAILITAGRNVQDGEVERGRSSILAVGMDCEKTWRYEKVGQDVEGRT